MKRITLLIIIFLLFVQLASAQGEFRFDIATQVAGPDNYTKHWSDTYPPDPKADIVIYSAAYNMSYKRMSALSFLYVVYDPMNNIVAVDKIDSFKRSYEPNVVYYTIHPKPDWVEGTYNVKVLVYDRVDHEAVDEKTTSDPAAIAVDPSKYKTFYDSGANAEDIGVLLNLGNQVAQGVLNFKIDKTVTIFPPDRFLLHDVRFTDDNTERILGEKLKIEVKIDNNYKDDGTVKLAMLVDNNLVSTQEVAVAGFKTSTVTFEAKAGKVGTFKLHFGADTPDVKYRNAELTFTIKNDTESTRLDAPKIVISGMNVDKEFVSPGDNVTVTITAINNGKSGSKTLTIYSNRIPVGSYDLNLQYLEEKTVDIPITLNALGINRITVSDAPQLFRNVFVQESDTSSMQESPIVQRVKGSPLKLSAVMVFLVFGGALYYIRKRLNDEESPAEIPAQVVKDTPKDSRLSGLRERLGDRIKSITKKKPPT